MHFVSPIRREFSPASSASPFSQPSDEKTQRAILRALQIARHFIPLELLSLQHSVNPESISQELQILAGIMEVELPEKTSDLTQEKWEDLCLEKCFSIDFESFPEAKKQLILSDLSQLLQRLQAEDNTKEIDSIVMLQPVGVRGRCKRIWDGTRKPFVKLGGHIKKFCDKHATGASFPVSTMPLGAPPNQAPRPHNPGPNVTIPNLPPRTPRSRTRNTPITPNAIGTVDSGKAIPEQAPMTTPSTHNGINTKAVENAQKLYSSHVSQTSSSQVIPGSSLTSPYSQPTQRTFHQNISNLAPSESKTPTLTSPPQSAAPLVASTSNSSFTTYQVEFSKPPTLMGSQQSSNPAAISPSLMDPIIPTDFNAKVTPAPTHTFISAQMEGMDTLSRSAAQIHALKLPPACSPTSITRVELKIDEQGFLARSNPAPVPIKTPVAANLTPPAPTSLVPTLNPIVQKALETASLNNQAALARTSNLVDQLKAVPTTPTIPSSNIPSKQPELIGMIDPDAPVRVYSTAPEIKPPIIFQLEGPKLARGCIGGINGIGNPLAEAQGNAGYIKKLAGNRHIEWVHNRTNSIPIDIAESVLVNYQGYSSPAKQLKEQWTNFHEKHKSDPEAKYLQFCHSQGALHVKNALASAPKEIRDRIIVVAIAPAGIVPDDLCFKSFNYASKRDPVPYGQAGMLMASGAPSVLTGAMIAETARELILLDPHPDAPLFDHSFQSLTFKDIIEMHLDDYTKKYGGFK